MRCGEIEVELQQGRSTFDDDKTITIREMNLEFRLCQLCAVHAENNRLFRCAICFDKNFRIAVVESNGSGYVGRGRYRGGRHEFGQIDVVREVDSRGTWQCLDNATVRGLKFQ